MKFLQDERMGYMSVTSVSVLQHVNDGVTRCWNEAFIGRKFLSKSGSPCEGRFDRNANELVYEHKTGSNAALLILRLSQQVAVVAYTAVGTSRPLADAERRTTRSRDRFDRGRPDDHRQGG